jgi:hypothetical protein
MFRQAGTLLAHRRVSVRPLEVGHSASVLSRRLTRQKANSCQGLETGFSHFPAEGYSHRRELDFGLFRSTPSVRNLQISLGRIGSDPSLLS